MIHVLFHGRALCPLEGVPAEWPDGHSWVSLDQSRLCTCPGCKKVLEAHEVVRVGSKVLLWERPKSLPKTPKGR